MSDLSLREAGPHDAATVTSVIHRAFGARRALDPPSTATLETVDSVRAVLAATGGALVERHGAAVGAMLFDESRPGQLGLRRVSVDPFMQSHGVASAMVGVAEDVAESRGLDGVWVTARLEMPENIVFWERRGYWRQALEGPLVELGKTLWLARDLPTSEAARDFGGRLATLLGPGDLVVLGGDLGAGKTTLTQGIGAGLGVRGDVTSPTFVISRVHPSLDGGPALVHVDAYRLGSAAELDDLDLDASLESAVTVVEWGSGVAEGLADDRLEVRLDRVKGDGSSAGSAALAAAGPRSNGPGGEPIWDPAPAFARDSETRVVRVRPFGRRWLGVRLRSTLLALPGRTAGG
jgi:tRNA threonylcarbamoyladenosine biosynthesis protein TsaE